MEINFIKVVDFPESATLGLVAYSPSGETNFLSPADAAAHRSCFPSVASPGRT